MENLHRRAADTILSGRFAEYGDRNKARFAANETRLCRGFYRIWLAGSGFWRITIGAGPYSESIWTAECYGTTMVARLVSVVFVSVHSLVASVGRFFTADCRIYGADTASNGEPVVTSVLVAVLRIGE
jgi:hypothetical protein